MKKMLVSMAVLVSVAMAEYRVVGYVPTYRAGVLDGLQWDKLTHVMASFVNPDQNGDFVVHPNIQLILDTLKNHPKVKSFISIGGGGVSASLWSTRMNSLERSKTVQKLADLAVQLGVNGVDVDLEGALVQSADYAPFVAELNKALRAKNLQMTAAVAKWTSVGIHDSTFAQFDFINLMAYDYKGPWDKKGNHAHSTILHAQTELDYYSITRKIAKDKIVLGVPFYGYDFFNLSNVAAFTWSDVVLKHPEALDEDSVVNSSTAKYYNGRKTIRTKANMAAPFGGLMIWELGQDDFPMSEFSLFTQVAAVKDSMEAFGGTTTIKVQNTKEQNRKISAFATWSLLNAQGKQIQTGEANSQGELRLMNLNPGKYYLKTSSGLKTIVIK